MTKKILLIALIGLFSLQTFSQNRESEHFKNNHGIEINDDPNDNLDIIADFTFECWIYVKLWEDEDVIFYRESSYGLELEPPSNGNGDFGLAFGMRDNNDNLFWTVSTSGYADLLEDTWYHVAVILNGNEIKLYINGNLASPTGWTHLFPSSYPLYLGAKNRNSTWSNQFNGYLDEVRFSNYARDINDLHTNMHMEEYTIDANTVFLMNFNDCADPSTFQTSIGLVEDVYSLNQTCRSQCNNVPSTLIPKYRSVQSGNWNNLSTWEVEYEEDQYTSPNFIPCLASETVTISSGHTVTIDEDSESNDLIILNGGNLIVNDSLFTYPAAYIDGQLTISSTGGVYISGSFNIQASGQVDVYGLMTIHSDVTNLAGPNAFVIKSTASTQGSLIVDREIDITIEKYIEGYSSPDDGWHLISTPIGNYYDPVGTDFEPGDNDDLFKWISSTNIWQNYKNRTFSMSKANGYLCSYEQTETKEFIGTTWFQYHCWSGPSSSVKWVLEGNVFPSAVIWNDGNWEINSASTTAKLWDESAGNYQDITSGDIIPAMQGFFVETEIGNFRLRFNEDSRTHSTTPWYKSTKTYDNSFVLKISGGGNTFSDKTRITFNPDATQDYDGLYDSHKLDGAASAPQIYSLNYSNEQFSTQQIPPSTFDTIINIRVKTPTISNYKIELSDYTLIQNKEIILEDRTSNKFINLSQYSSYEFLSSTTEISNRFKIHIGKATSTEDIDTPEENILTFYKNKQLYIQAINQGMQEISLWNTNGQQVYSQKINTNQNQSINTNIAPGIYVLRINNLAQKIFIQ